MSYDEGRDFGLLPNLKKMLFLEKYFFLEKKTFWTSLWTRNMYHTWSGVSTAINIALKFARLGQFMAIIEAIIKADFF